MTCSAAAISGLLFIALGTPSGATPATPATAALDAATAAFAKIDDYRMTIAVHEISGERVENRTYSVLFKKPMLERIDIVSGPGKGGGIVWLGGETVKGHRGGLLSAIHLTFDLHSGQVVTLRGDAVNTATIPAMLADFSTIKGSVSEASGPQIDGAQSSAVTLDVADPAADDGVSREVLYLSDTTHLPLRRERFAGTLLVKSENVSEIQTNLGLTASDFPW
jgi:outer membrane lipoprotein-sorting protein